jgi:hypothetical protein
MKVFIVTVENSLHVGYFFSKSKLNNKKLKYKEIEVSINQNFVEGINDITYSAKNTSNMLVYNELC